MATHGMLHNTGAKGRLRSQTLGQMLNSYKRATGIFNIHMEQTGPQVPKGLIPKIHTQ